MNAVSVLLELVRAQVVIALGHIGNRCEAAVQLPAHGSAVLVLHCCGHVVVVRTRVGGGAAHVLELFDAAVGIHCLLPAARGGDQLDVASDVRVPVAVGPGVDGRRGRVRPEVFVLLAHHAVQRVGGAHA